MHGLMRAKAIVLVVVLAGCCLKPRYFEMDAGHYVTKSASTQQGPSPPSPHGDEPKKLELGGKRVVIRYVREGKTVVEVWNVKQH